MGPEIWKKTSFFTSGNHVDLFLDLKQHLEDMNIDATISDSVFKVKFDATPSQTKKVLPSQRQRQSSKARKRLKSPRKNPRQLALSNFSESRTSRRQRMTRSLRRLKRTTNPKSPAALTSPTETSHQRNLTARKTTFPISKHGKPSSTHG